MGWHKETYNAIRTRLLAEAPSVLEVSLWNNQFEDLKDEAQNEELPWRMPCAFIEHTGGEWARQGAGRTSQAYTISIHLGWETYNDGVEHLDIITEVANALDAWAWVDPTHVYSISMLYRREFVDQQRTNVVEHVLQFECRAEDCSQAAANPTTMRTVTSEKIIRT